jgi:hypothetical protein
VGESFSQIKPLHEYLGNRLDAISARTQSHEGLKVAADKFVVTLEKSLQEHSLPKGREIIDAAKLAAKTITEIVDATLRSEPNSLRSDDVLSQVMKLFEGKTGTNLDSNRNAVAKLEGFGDNLVTPCTKMQQSTPKMSPVTPLKAVASYT